ncbi:DUF4870 domain-containing protein [Flaviflexus massiliensis]|uniref:DUF4870 domain-containing protein n=1 Tax=Flaviflexus massiliensis TaxID=1522309 RepID=UPI0006D58797|nr:DUF4870 domain-containing protein [Flaviflexus massiliensis]
MNEPYPYRGSDAWNNEPRYSDDERTWAILAHLSAPAGTIFSAGWLGFLGPLLIWMFQKNKSRLVRKASARAFNYSLALFLLNIVAWMCFFTFLLIPLAIVLWVLEFILILWSPIRGAMAASKGKIYRYPFSIPILH